MKRRFAPALLASLALVSPLLLTGPFDLFAANASEFSRGWWDMFLRCVPFVAGIFFAIALCSYLSDRILAVVLAAAVGVYVQGKFLVWDYGILDGREVEWGNYGRERLIEVAVWGPLFAVALFFPGRVKRAAPVLPLFLIIAHLLSAGVAASHGGILWKAPPAAATPEQMFRFTKGESVILIVLDTFESPAFEKILAREPALRTKLAGFTWYRDALAGFTTTAPSIPFLLAGKRYDNSLPFRAFLAKELPGSLTDKLQASGVTVDLATLGDYCPYLKAHLCLPIGVILDPANFDRMEFARLIDFALFRTLPHDLKRVVYNDEQWFLQQRFGKRSGPRHHVSSIEFAEAIVRNAKAEPETREPMFKLLHLLVPHPPLRLDANCEYRVPDPKREVKTEMYEAQARCALKLVERMAEKLKAIGVWNTSTVIVTSDHGAPVQYFKYGERETVPHIEAGLPLVLVKPKGAGGELKTSDAPVALNDLPPFVAKAFGKREHAEGESIDEVGVGVERERRYRHYRWNHRDWYADYLPNMREYAVNGSAWKRENWRLTRELRGGGIEVDANERSESSRN